MTRRFPLGLGLSTSWLLFLLMSSVTARADDAPTAAAKPADPANKNSAEKPKDKFKPLPPPKGLVRLAKDYDVWVDLKRKLVVVDGKVSLRDGQLEMFACPKGTKEHESVVAVNSKASFVHAGLIAVGAKTGRPVKFDPEYVPATGVEVEVMVLWVDEKGMRHKVRAQEWVHNVKTDKAMQLNWVFAGSGFWTDEQTGQRHYNGDAGDFICVSNFPTATLDLPVKSSAATAGLLFKAYTKNIPPKGTHVRLVLIPKLKKESVEKKK